MTIRLVNSESEVTFKRGEKGFLAMGFGQSEHEKGKGMKILLMNAIFRSL